MMQRPAPGQPDNTPARSTTGPALRLLIAAGGTGGHLYPGIAVARCFQARCPGTEVVFVGHKGGLEEHLLPREGFPLYLVRPRHSRDGARFTSSRPYGP